MTHDPDPVDHYYNLARVAGPVVVALGALPLLFAAIKEYDELEGITYRDMGCGVGYLSLIVLTNWIEILNDDKCRIRHYRLDF